jgi:Flp pilus assembly protein TadG
MRMIRVAESFVRRVRKHESGAMAILVALSCAFLLPMTALVVDVGYLLHIQRLLQTSTDAAALAGAQYINTGSAISEATLYSAVTGNKNAQSNLNVTMASGYPQLKCLTSTGISCSGSDSANAIVVMQQAQVTPFFGNLIGVNSIKLSAESTAGAKGGGLPALNVMIIVDTTQSMNDPDSSCNATRIACALVGVRTLLGELWPTVDNVGLMVFPGLKNATQAQYDYTCNSLTQPTTVAYNNSPVYQVLGLSNNYKTSNATTSLNTASDLALAVGAGPSGCTSGLNAVGGFGTFYADVITAAQTALAANSTSNVQNVIIFISDGGANADSTKVPSGEASNQCHEAVTAAQAAAAAGTNVYAIAYGASTSTNPSTCTTDSPVISSCSTMQQIASDSSKFYADTSGGSSDCTSSANPISDLPSIFQAVGNSLGVARLLPNNTT